MTNPLKKSCMMSRRLLAGLLDISVSTLNRMEDEGDVPVHIIVGRRRFYPVDAVQEWIAEKRFQESMRRMSTAPRLRGRPRKDIPRHISLNHAA